jgi:hypothetical protein
MTIDINKRMMEKHSETVKQTEAERAILITAVVYGLTVLITVILLWPI